MMKSKRIKHQHVQKFGGYLMYWGLVKQMEKARNNMAFENISQFKKLRMNFKMLGLYAFVLTIKPLKQFYSYKTIVQGEIDFENEGQIIRNQLEKTKTLKIFNIPFASYKCKLNDDDWEKVLN